MAVWLSVLFGIANRGIKQRDAQEAMYSAYLDSVAPNILVLSQRSPELDSATKLAIERYLNRHFRGWSLVANTADLRREQA